MNDNKPEPSKLPPPIEPVRGSGYVKSTPPPPPPIDWEHWRLMPVVALRQAVALSVNINPDAVHMDKAGEAFKRRLDIAISHSTVGSLKLEVHYPNQVVSPVKLSQFSAWAVELNFPDLPPELVAMAAPPVATKATPPQTAPKVPAGAFHEEHQEEVLMDEKLLKPYLDYSHWTLLESAYLLNKLIPLPKGEFMARDMNSGGSVGHLYRRLKDATIDELPAVPSGVWAGYCRVRPSDVLAWAANHGIAVPPELVALVARMAQAAPTVPPESQGKPAVTAGTNPCAAFLAMENLVGSEVSIVFVGDRSDSGLGANNMLEISARSTTKRVALAALDLVDKRKGVANFQAGILLGMAQKTTLKHTAENAARMTRLRDALRKHLGVTGDPFERYDKSTGWVPIFKIVDKRGASEDRAKRDAERRTDSFEQLNEQGERFATNDDDESGSGAAWLKANDPDAQE